MREEVLIRVLIVDDHALLADSLAAALGSEPGLEVLGVATTSREARRMMSAVMPDVVLLDFRLPDADGADLATQLLSIHPDTHVLVFTGYEDDAALSRAIKAGCSGYLHKSADLESVVEAIRLVHSGELAYSARSLSRLVRDMQRGEVVGGYLTAREREVLELLANGYTTEDLAEHLIISKHTARSHVRNILMKLDVHSKLEAVTLALKLGLVEVKRQTTSR